jgi:hypothetical protein
MEYFIVRYQSLRDQHFASILVFFYIGLKTAKSWQSTILRQLFLAQSILLLSLKLPKFNSGILFYNSIYERSGKSCELSVNPPSIKKLSIQGTELS